MRTLLIGTGSIGGTVAVMIKEIENGERKISVANIAEL